MTVCNERQFLHPFQIVIGKSKKRTERDSNPRYKNYPVHRFSKPAPSATRPSVQGTPSVNKQCSEVAPLRLFIRWANPGPRFHRASSGSKCAQIYGHLNTLSCKPTLELWQNQSAKYSAHQHDSRQPSTRLSAVELFKLHDPVFCGCRGVAGA